MNLPLSGCTFGWLHHRPLTDALRELAAGGVRSIELTTSPPHLFTPALGAYERQELARTLRALRLEVVSVNPSYADLNLISTNPELREVSERHIAAELELAAQLEAGCVVVIPGRRHALAPAPEQAARAVLDEALGRLTERARQLGVVIALENNPYGFLGGADDLVALAERWDTPWLRVAYDTANALATEDPADGVRRVGRHLAIAHVSDTWRDRWAHTSPGRGEVDFERYAEALRSIGFDGVTIYELIDMEPPLPRLRDDIATFEKLGWSRATRGNVPRVRSRS